MNTILLEPTDVLFFRDGRPMEGSLAGHGAAWPLPSVINAAFHAALHRAGLNGLHLHDQIDKAGNRAKKDVRLFGSLVTAGPFPVKTARETGKQEWFVPRPLDAQMKASTRVTLLPARTGGATRTSSLPAPLVYPVASLCPPTKEKPEPWINCTGYAKYLKGNKDDPATFVADSEVLDTEANIGIAIDPDTQTTGQGATEGRIYEANYLRLRPSWRLGVLAKTGDKHDTRDLIPILLKRDHRILVGGQQRVCTAENVQSRGAPLPLGLLSEKEFKRLPNGRYAVKWVLLAPATWPEIPPRKKDGSPQNPHPGGWLPNWVFLDWAAENRAVRPNERNGNVLLKLRSGEVRRDYSGPRPRRVAERESDIAAKLVAAIVPKPLVVTGWALPQDNAERPDGGAKSTHLAVPAGAVYYFEADSPKDAAALAQALNWHDTTGTEVKNRRSTLCGEKGFGLGVCGTWNFFEDQAKP